MLALSIAVAITASPRIVTAGPWVTETVFALGSGADIIAVDKASTFPAQVEKLPQIGFHRALAFEGLVSLQPTLVLLGNDAGPPQVARQLGDAGIKTVVAPEVIDVRRVAELVSVIAAALGRPGDSVAKELTRAVDAAIARAAAMKGRPRVLAIYARGPQVLSILGTKTATQSIVDAANGELVAAGIEGFAPLTAEAVLSSEPQMLLFSTRGLASLGGATGLKNHPVLGQLEAVKNGRVVTLDDALILGIGPRTPHAIDALAEALHGKH